MTLPAATASTGSPSVTYTLSPSLPAGLSFDAAARTVTGTPTAAAASASYTYTAGATDYTSATLTFSIVVAEPAPALSFGDAAIADQSYVKDTAIDTLNLPAATGGSGAITYSLSPSLPAGLSFDAAARTITGTPTAAATGATYRYSATDGTDTVMLSFSIEVTAAEEGASGQSGLSWVTAPPTVLEWTQGVAVNVTLPAATGSNSITYKLSEGCGAKGAKLPQGITWNASTRTLSGTPTKWFSTRVACYQAYASNKGTPGCEHLHSGGGHVGQPRALRQHQEQRKPAARAAMGEIRRLLQRLRNLRPQQRPHQALLRPGKRHADLHGGFVQGSRHQHQFQRLRRGEPQASAPELVLLPLHGDGPRRALRLDFLAGEAFQLLGAEGHQREFGRGDEGSDAGREQLRRRQQFLNIRWQQRRHHQLLRSRLLHRRGYGEERGDAGLRDQDLAQGGLPVHRRKQDDGRQNPDQPERHPRAERG